VLFSYDANSFPIRRIHESKVYAARENPYKAARLSAAPLKGRMRRGQADQYLGWERKHWVA
jgi:hypothetical protein